MTEDTINAIEQVNSSGFLQQFIDVAISGMRVLLPIGLGIAFFFLIFRLFRKVLGA